MSVSVCIKLQVLQQSFWSYDPSHFWFNTSTYLQDTPFGRLAPIEYPLGRPAAEGEPTLLVSSRELVLSMLVDRWSPAVVTEEEVWSKGWGDCLRLSALAMATATCTSLGGIRGVLLGPEGPI